MAIRNKRTANSVLIVLLLLCFFEDPIQSKISLFTYFDEFVAALAIPIFFIRCLWHKNKRKRKETRRVVSLLLMYVIFGVLGFVINSDQPSIACLGDIFLNLKFFLAIYVGYTLFDGYNISYRKLMYFVSIISSILAILLVVNFIHPIFPNQEYRFGIEIPRLFFSHSSYLASAGVLLLVITYKIYPKMRMPLPVLGCELFIIFATLRYRAIAAAIVSIVLYNVIIVRRSKLKFYHYVIVATGVLLIAWDQISVYYGTERLSNARGALTVTSFRVANDLFPLGAGFGTFASHMSKVYYSQYYYTYGINTIWGLSQNYSSFISDTFWPMIIGQTGYLGALSYIAALYYLYRIIRKTREVNVFDYVSTLCAFAYLLIESTSSAAFVGPNTIPLGLWIGVIICKNKREIFRNGSLCVS